MTGISPIWPKATAWDNNGELTFHGRTAASLLEEFGSPLYLMDTDELRSRAHRFVSAAAQAFPTSTTHVSFAAKTFLTREVARIVTQEGMLVDTCSMGEMRIALAAGVPGRRLVLHGNNKSDEEIELAVREGFDKIVVDEPGEPARIAAIARRVGKRARVMLRVTCGIHAGGHEYISTAHEDQKFGVALLPQGARPEIFDVLDRLDDPVPQHGGDCGNDAVRLETTGSADVSGSKEATLGHALDYSMHSPYDASLPPLSGTDRALMDAMEAVAAGPALAVLNNIAALSDDLELVGIHSHIGSQIHDANAFIQAGQRMMLLRRTFYATDGYILPEVDLGGGYSVAYTDAEDSMDIEVELGRLARATNQVNQALGMPAPAISFEPGRWIAGPAGVTLYRVGAIKHVALPEGTKDSAGKPIAERVYVSVDGGMSDNIRPALYGADYTAVVAGRCEKTESAIKPSVAQREEVQQQSAEETSDSLRVMSGADNGTGAETMLARVVGMHCESGDIVVNECRLPSDLKRGDVLAVPVTGAYGRTMASNYNQALIPAVVAVSGEGAHVMLRRQTIEDLLDLDQG